MVSCMDQIIVWQLVCSPPTHWAWERLKYFSVVHLGSSVSPNPQALLHFSVIFLPVGLLISTPNSYSARTPGIPRAYLGFKFAVNFTRYYGETVKPLDTASRIGYEPSPSLSSRYRSDGLLLYGHLSGTLHTNDGCCCMPQPGNVQHIFHK